mgnify:FL=1
MINDVSGGSYVITSTNNLADIRKYNASSFYNWEQDNIPINDLETRTNSLGANIGLTATGIAGATLVLSSAADNDNSIYDDIDDIVTRIPKILTFPLLVEICSYGNLGALKLEGISIKGNGSLQFINRNFGHSLHGDSAYEVVVSSTEDFNGVAFSGAPEEQGCTSLSAYPIWEEISNASSTRAELNCYSKDSWNQNVRLFGHKHLTTDATFQEPIFWCSGTRDFIGSTTDSDYVFSGNVYDNSYDVTVSADANPLEYNTSGQIPMRKNAYLSTMAAGNAASPLYAYGNYFTSVKVENCHGEQVQLKNICVDGVSATAGDIYSHDNSIGFDIQNSDVVLTSCASFRNRDAGFKIKNSNVDIEGGIIGYRNYQVDGSAVVADLGYRPSTGFEATDMWDLASNGNGFEASRSTINFDETGSLTNASGTSKLGKHGFIMASNGGNGWLFDKCKINGGVGGHNSEEEQGAGTEDYQTTQLIAAFNKVNGFKVDSSQVKYQGILRAQGNEIHGIEANNSRVASMGLVSEVNGNTGFKLDSSEYIYNMGASKYTTAYDLSLSSWHSRAGHSRVIPAVLLDRNSVQNLTVTNNSKFSDNRLTNSGRRAGLIGGRYLTNATQRTNAMLASNGTIVDPTNVSEFEKGNLPLISVSNNSYARLLGLAALGDTFDGAGGNSVVPSGSVKGRALSVTDNSKVDLYGTSAYNTNIGMYQYINTLSELKTTWTKSVIYAGQNSKIRISGPTKISNFGVAALAEDNSKIEIGPALSELGTPDTSLDPTDVSGHSMVELHATRACLVANNKSTLEMVKCGADIGTPDGTWVSSINSVDADLATSAYHTSSFIQFYPNGFTAELANPGGGRYVDQNFFAAVSSIAGARNRQLPGFDEFVDPNRFNHNSNSTGGMCVRAVGGSTVIADQVNFEVHMPVDDLSGAYYNIDGSAAEGTSIYTGMSALPNVNQAMGSASAHYGGSQIFMWNIADNSRINASNLKVNGVDGSAAGFHGPAGRWGSFAAGMGSEESLGPIDYYGKTGAYGQISPSGDVAQHYNHGPFRLMTGISADLMTYSEGVEALDGLSYVPIMSASGIGGNAIAQLNAQGYPGPGYTASSIYASDHRQHSLIETQTQSSQPNYGQPIFGARGGADGGNVTGGNTRHLIGNAMIQDVFGFDGDGAAEHTFPNIPIPPIHMEWQGYLRNFVDESAADVFANAKHGASKMIKLCSIYRSTIDPTRGGEGRDGNPEEDYAFGRGVRSLNIFDLDKLV